MAWVTITEAIQILEVSERTLYRRIKAGELQTRKEDGRVLVDVGAAEQRKTVAGTIRHLADVTTASAVHQAQQQQSLTRQLSDAREWRDQLKSDLETARTDVKRARRWGAVFGLAGLGLLVGGGLGWHQRTTRHTTELEGVRIELSDQRGRGVVLNSQLADREQQLDHTQVELTRTAGELAGMSVELVSVTEQWESAVGQRDRLAIEVDQARAAIAAEQRARAAGGLWSRFWRSLTSRPGEPAATDS